MMHDMASHDGQVTLGTLKHSALKLTLIFQTPLIAPLPTPLASARNCANTGSPSVD